MSADDENTCPGCAEPPCELHDAIPGIDCFLGPRVGSEDFDYDPPRCACGCPLVYLNGWVCEHCDS